MAEYLDPRRLLPAAHDQVIAALGLEVDQFDEPAWHLVGGSGGAALDDDFLGGDTYHADAGEVAAVENRTDHQFDHRRVVRMWRHRQAEGGGSVLRVGAQLADQLLAGALHASDEAAGEGHHQEQADGEEQLFE
ncbi:hypothetical protein D9M68_828980 [compost metagenome]